MTQAGAKTVSARAGVAALSTHPTVDRISSPTCHKDNGRRSIASGQRVVGAEALRGDG